MLKDIKSLYFIKIILFHLNDAYKFKIIKYNKTLQKILNIKLIDYIYFSKRYIIYESNIIETIGREYNFENDKLIFEGTYKNKVRNGIGKEYFSNQTIIGEYLNGIRNGKFKEYINGHLIFEGDYLNGKRNGKGKNYSQKGVLMFDGEYLNGKKWNGKGFNNINNTIYELKNGKGYIKEYNNFGILIFEGEYLNGERNGKGKEYYFNGSLMFEGEYLNDKRNGKGKEYNNFGILKFEGEYLNGKRWNGKGYNQNQIIFELNNGKGFIKESFKNNKMYYECEYLNGQKNGKATEYYITPFGTYLAFEGEYLNDERTGKGKEYSYNGKLIFEGEYLNGKRNGRGKEYCLYNGKLIFEGEYFKNYRRKGKEYLGDILIYEGEYILDKKWEGKGFDGNGNVIYELKNGNGIIKEYEMNKNKLSIIFEGEYKNGRRNGKGKEYRNGILMFEGEYINGKRKKI